MSDSAGLEKRARNRAGVTSTGIGVAFDHAITQPGDDALRWLLVASDGNRTAPIEARISRSEQTVSWVIPTLTIQRVLERYAGRFAAESRLDDLVAATPIYLRDQDFRDSDFDPADSALAP